MCPISFIPLSLAAWTPLSSQSAIMETPKKDDGKDAKNIVRSKAERDEDRKRVSMYPNKLFSKKP